jgi:acetyl esterase/lipase
VIAVYKDLLKTYKPAKIAIYGTSAGGSLTAQSAVRIRRDKLPQPAALGIFSSGGDPFQNTDSGAMYGTAGLVGAVIPAPGVRQPFYLGNHDPKDPLASPINADLKGFPPTLSMSATRDSALVSTVNFNRALRRAGVDADLVVFDALPHAFWYTMGIPESTEALATQAQFFDRHLGGK